MAVELGDTIGQVGAGAYRLVKGKDVDITEAIDGTSITIANDDLFLIDDGPTGTQATTKKVTGSQLKTFIGSVTVDSSITDGSTNPVQNNAVHDALDLKLNLAGGTMTGDITLPTNGKIIFDDAGEYIKGDGTDLTIASSGNMILDCDGGDVTIQDSGTAKPKLILKNTADAYGTPPIISFEVVPNNVGSGTDTGASGDDIGRLDFKSNDDAGNETTYVRILSEIAVATNGQEGGKLNLQVASHDAEMVDGLIIQDGTEEDEVDVTIGNGDNSVTIIKGKLAFGDSATFANIILDEDDFATNSNSALPTQQSVKAYVDNRIRDIKFSGFYGSYSGGTKMFIPINGTTSESTGTGSGNDWRAFVAPFDGYLDQVVVRSEVACNSSVVGLHKSSTGTEVPSSTPTGTVTVNMNNDDTAFKFDFTSNNTFSAGDIIAISFTPSSQSQDTNFTMIFVYDTTQGV